MEDIDARIDWVQFYAEETGKTPKPAGAGKYNMCCPFHSEKNPSFWFNTVNGCWKCETGCGSGNATTFLARLRGIDNAEAYKLLLDRAGVKDEPAKPKPNNLSTSLAEYVEAKRLPLDFLKKLGLEDRTDNRGVQYVRLPYYDADGRLSAVKHRYNPGNQMRFSWDAGGTVIPYGVWLRTNRSSSEMVLVEGESDAQACWVHGVAALGIPGATNFQSAWVDKYLSKVETIYLHQEPDAGGAKFREKTMHALYEAGYKGKVLRFAVHDVFPDCKDPSDIHAKGKVDSWAPWIAEHAEPLSLTDEGATVSQAKPEAEKPKIAPLQTYKASDLYGVHLDRPPVIIRGMVPAGLTVLAGAPKRGKSWLALSMAIHVAAGEPFFGFAVEKGDVLYLDLESRQYRVQDRLSKLIPGRAPELLQIAHESGRLEAGLTEQLDMWCESVEHPVLIIIDTLGRVKGGSRKGENAYEGDTRILGDLQRFAMKRKLAIVCVHHLRKSTAGDTDYFERISGSMGLTGACDSVIVLSGKRGEEDSQLNISGRDFEATEMTIGFNNGNWQLRSTDSETYYAEKEYNSSAYVRGIIRIAEKYHHWQGSPRTLMEALCDLGITVEDSTATTFSKKIAAFQQMLHDRDGVLVSWARMHSGRQITISKVDTDGF